jgi:uncharacterized SAM-binding protein YcdF (DUF218 family)
MGNFLIVNEAPQKSDVIIVLAGPSFAMTGERVAYAAELYQSAYADKVLLSGDKPYMTQQAISNGIPANALLLEDQSETTFENAEYSLKIVRAQGYRSAIVVTSPYHTLRSSIIFAHFFKGVHLTICPVPYRPTMTQSWWKNNSSAEFVMSEYLKLVWYYVIQLH